MKPNRALRVGQLLRKELADLFLSPKMDLKRYFLTVTEVRLSRDLKYGDVWVSVYGDTDLRSQAIGLLREESKRIRYLLASAVHLRHIPELRFKLDETLDHAERIDRILEESGIMDSDDMEDSVQQLQDDDEL